MTGLVSVIIPVYNAEKSIEMTLNSVLNQTYSNLEILIVDDGSTDSTTQIINAYSDPRIVYIFQQNQGPASAKNTGIKHASGEWVMFVDSDDSIKNNAIEKLYYFAMKNDGDLIVYSYSRTNQYEEVLDAIDVSSTKIDEMFTAAWNKFYKKSVIKSLRFPEKTYFEDVAFSAMAATVAHNILAVNEYFYFYKQHSNSITKQNWLPKRHEDIITDFEYMFSFFSKNNIVVSSDQEREIRNVVNRSLFSHIYQIAVSKNDNTLKNQSIVALMDYQKRINGQHTVHYSANKILHFKDKILVSLAKLKLYRLVKIIGDFSNIVRGKSV